MEPDNDGSQETLGKEGEAGRVSCAGCHIPTEGFVDTRSPHHQISLGALWSQRRTPTLLEVGFAPLYNWDGRRDAIWNQAVGVIESNREFNSSRLFVAGQIFRLYRADYEAIFGPMPPLDDLARFPALLRTQTGCTASDGGPVACHGVPGDKAEFDTMKLADQNAVKQGKLNHFEVLVSEQSIEVTITPYSDDGKTFAPATFDYKVNTNLPFARGYVHLSVHNHAMLKYTQSDSPWPAIVDATVAQIDNVGFDGPVISNWREYEVSDALVKFNDASWMPWPDPYNKDNTSYEVGYFAPDFAAGPSKALHISQVDLANATKARLAFSAWFDFLDAGDPTKYAMRARVNGKDWHEHVLSAEEANLFTKNPTVLDSTGKPLQNSNPHTQGRLALLIDVPIADLVAGDNTIEFVSANAPPNLTPVVGNIDLVLEAN